MVVILGEFERWVFGSSVLLLYLTSTLRRGICGRDVPRRQSRVGGNESFWTRIWGKL